MDQRLTQKVWREGGPLLDENDGGEPASTSAFKLTFEDICYVLFRHKWKILFLTLAGLVAAGFVYKTSPRLYRSEAKLMVKYITEMELPTAGAGEGQLRSPVLRGEAVVNSEVEILTSMNLALKVAEAVGPERILAKVGGGNDVVSAALVVHGGTLADVPRRGNVIRVTFQHPDPTVVRPVLSNLVEQYFTKHVEIHRALASLDDFTQQRAQVGDRLHSTEQTLWDLKRTNGIFAVQESKKAAAEQVARVQQGLSEAETELATREAALASLQTALPKDAATAALAAAGQEERRDQYQLIRTQLEQARRRKLELLGQFRETNPWVQKQQEQIARLEKQKKEMEQQDPTLSLSNLSMGSGIQGSGGGSSDLFGEAGRITILRAKVDALKSALARARADEANLYALEAPIVQLERSRELEEARYRLLSSALEQAQIGSGMGASPNISRVQDPTPPARDIGGLYKKVAACAAGGLLLGLAMAVLMEFFVDQSVKRPIELSRILPLPVLMSIPKAGRKARAAVRNGLAPRLALVSGSRSASVTEQHLQPYIEALRDRILNRFETLARKPKLVGVCGCAPGAGVTSIAAGLAASLSEAGDLKVLLVDMKRGHGRSHPMLGSRKTCTLVEALEGPKRQEGLIAPNLYLASAGSGNQQVMTSPRKFMSVVPQLNTSDYDYIVFDMPPVDQVSITPRLAKHMDLTLMVVEAEKAHQSTVKQAGSLLLEFSQNVAVVLNKTRDYLPKQISQAA